MTAADRQQRIAVSFACRYYSTLVEQPASLPGFYFSTASVNHVNRRAKGTAELTALFTSLYSVGTVKAVKIEDMIVTCTTMGNLLVSFKGMLTLAKPSAKEQRFSQEIELRELRENTFAVAADTFAHIHAAPVAAASAVHWATETPPMFAMPSAKAAAEIEEISQPTTTQVTAAAAAAEKREAEPAKKKKAAAAEAAKEATPVKEEKVVASAVDISKLSFAERLRLKEATGAAAAPAVKPIRVTAKVSKKEADKEDAAAEEGKRKASEGRSKKEAGEGRSRKEAGEGRAKKEAGEGRSRKEAGEGRAKKEAGEGRSRKETGEGEKKPRSAGRSVIFYHIIIKGLAENTTEEDIRIVMGSTAPVKLIKVESRLSKRDAKGTRTFAFVQLDDKALKEAGTERAAAIAAVLEDVKARKALSGEMNIEEVVERKYTA